MRKNIYETLLATVICTLTLAGCGQTAAPAAPAVEYPATLESYTAVSASASTETYEASPAEAYAASTTASGYEKTEEDAAETEEHFVTDEELIKAAGLNGSESISPAEVTKMILDVDAVEDLSQLAYFTSLEMIDARSEMNFDVDWVSYCPNLKWLRLEYKSLKDLTPVTNLQNLEHLCVVTYGIEDLSFVTGMESLRDLYIECDSVCDMSAVTGNPNLQYITVLTDTENLNCGTDWSPLTNLRVVVVECDYIADYNFVKTIPVNPVYNVSGEEREERETFLHTNYADPSLDLRANKFRSQYDYDVITDDVCLTHLEFHEERRNISGIPAGRLTVDDPIAAAVIAELSSGLPGGMPDYTAVDCLSTWKDYEALSKLGFYINFETDRDMYKANYQFLRIGNQVYKANIMGLMFETLGNPITPIKSAPESAEEIHSNAPDTFRTGAVWCDGITYGMEVRIADMINHGKDYTFYINDEQIKDIDQTVENYIVDTYGTTLEIRYRDNTFVKITTDQYQKNTCLKDAVIEKLEINNLPGLTVELPQGNENIHHVTMDFYTGDIFTTHYQAYESDLGYSYSIRLAYEDQNYNNAYDAYFEGVEDVEDDCDYCNDEGMAYSVKRIIISGEFCRNYPTGEH